MVGFSTFIVLSAISGAFASPVEKEAQTLTDVVFRRSNSTDLARRTTTNFNQDFTTGGDVIFSPNGNFFEVQWDTPSNSEDFVVGRGFNPGSRNPISFSGTFGAGSGTGLLSVYGWSTNPLVEYYIVEDSLNPPTFGTQKGSVTSDGSTYTIWENTRTNEPSILGTSTFQQFISVRSSKRASGTVTVANHFNAWAALGMNLGTLNYQVIAVEGWGGEGIAQITVG